MDTVLNIWNCIVPAVVIYLVADLYCRIKFDFTWLQDIKTHYREGGIFSKCMIIAHILSFATILSLTVYFLIVT